MMPSTFIFSWIRWLRRQNLYESCSTPLYDQQNKFTFTGWLYVVCEATHQREVTVQLPFTFLRSLFLSKDWFVALASVTTHWPAKSIDVNLLNQRIIWLCYTYSAFSAFRHNRAVSVYSRATLDGKITNIYAYFWFVYWGMCVQFYSNHRTRFP